MSWEVTLMPVLILGGLAGAFGVWHLLEDLILDSIPLPFPPHFDGDTTSTSRE
jgi:hypothetical protein